MELSRLSYLRLYAAAIFSVLIASTLTYGSSFSIKDEDNVMDGSFLPRIIIHFLLTAVYRTLLV